MTDDKFFSKMAKPISEFMILSILKEKGESHPYEIQQILLSKFSNQKSHSLEMLILLSSINEKIIAHLHDEGITEEEVVTEINKLPDENFQSILKRLIDQSKKDVEIKSLLEELQSELLIIKDHFMFPGKIWETIGAIYQVMKELENLNYIEMSKRAIVNGRTRKLYRITETGEIEALRMLLIFNSVNSSIYPEFTTFSKTMENFYGKHYRNLNILFAKLLTTENSSTKNVKNLLSKTNLESMHVDGSPLNENQFMIIIQLLGLKAVSVKEISKMFSLGNSTNNDELIDQLNDFKNRIADLVNLMS